MTRDRAEKLGSLFLAIVSTGLTAQLAIDGMSAAQWGGAVAAVLGSLSLAAGVRLFPQPEQQPVRVRNRD